jgi:predicted lysophospholipase L1 biosynthesis ABC-type transport system permease subunit
MARIDEAWRKVDDVHSLDAAFYSDQIESAYSMFSVMVKVIGFLSVLAICTSSLGLFGMVVFTTETRLREISIRKVLGAGEANLIYMLSKGFFLLLISSAIIALPITYLVFDRLILPNIAYHLPIGFELFAGFLAVGAIALIMIGSQTFKVARTNPADVLKTE